MPHKDGRPLQKVFLPLQINRSGPLQRKPLQDAQQTGALPPSAVPTAPAIKASAQQTPGGSAAGDARDASENLNPEHGPSRAPPPPPPLPPRGALLRAVRKAAGAGAAAAARGPGAAPGLTATAKAGGVGAPTAEGPAAKAPVKAPAQAGAFVPSAASLQELRAGGPTGCGLPACWDKAHDLCSCRENRGMECSSRCAQLHVPTNVSAMRCRSLLHALLPFRSYWIDI